MNAILPLITVQDGVTLSAKLGPSIELEISPKSKRLFVSHEQLKAVRDQLNKLLELTQSEVPADEIIHEMKSLGYRFISGNHWFGHYGYFAAFVAPNECTPDSWNVVAHGFTFQETVENALAKAIGQPLENQQPEYFEYKG